MKERIISKGLVFAVIILFVGVSIQPAIAKVQAENIYVEYFDVTTEFIGLDKTYTTQLTKQEIEKLDALFNSINEHLNKSASFKDSIEIFKKVIFELNSFGLLGNRSLNALTLLTKLSLLVQNSFNKSDFNVNVFKNTGGVVKGFNVKEEEYAKF